MPLQLTLALYQGRKTEINATTSAPPINVSPLPSCRPPMSGKLFPPHGVCRRIRAEYRAVPVAPTGASATFPRFFIGRGPPIWYGCCRRAGTVAAAERDGSGQRQFGVNRRQSDGIAPDR